MGKDGFRIFIVRQPLSDCKVVIRRTVVPVVKPPSGRCVIKDMGDSLRIIIPSRKNWLMIAFLGFWLVGWAFSEIMVGGMVLSGLARVLSGGLTEESGGLVGFSGVS